MASQQVINVGSANNDHSGDTLRSAMQKTNINVAELFKAVNPNSAYGKITVNNSIIVGNATVQSTINSTAFSGQAADSLMLNTVPAAKYVQNSDSRVLSGNLSFTAANVTFTQGVNLVSNNFIVNSTAVYSNLSIVATSIRLSGVANAGGLNVSGSASVGGDLVVNGQLYVAGNTTFINATVITTNDKTLWIANNAASAIAADGAGIQVGTYANLVYDNTTDSWQSNVGITPIANNYSLGSNSNLWALYANTARVITLTTTGNATFVNAYAGYIVLGSMYANSTGIYANGQSVYANNLTAFTKVQVGSAAGYNFGSLAVIEIDASQNTYVQSVIQNANSGTNATGDLVITADTGNDSVNYIDLGINSSTYSNANYTVVGALDGYLYASNGNLGIGTASNMELVFHANGTTSNDRKLTVNGSSVYVNTGVTFSVSSNAVLANGSGVYTTGTVNALSYTLGSIFVANSSTLVSNGMVVNNSILQHVGTVNAVTFGVNTAFVVNSTIMTANGFGANSTAFFSNSFTANSSGLFSNVVSTTNVNSNVVTANSYGTVNATSFLAGNTTTGTGGSYANSTVVLVGNNTVNGVHTSTSLSIANSTANAVVNTSGVYVNSIPLQTIQNTFRVDFGANAVYTTRGTISDSRVTANSSVTTVVSVYPSGANSLANGTSNTVFYGDELEMDTFQCAAYVSTNGTINYYITTIPGPVSNTRIFNYILS
jgi:hypothetical protein